MPWSTFLRAHRECLVATDFLTLEVCTIRGLVTHYVMLFIDIVNRAVKIAGITAHPDSRWMTQICLLYTSDAADDLLCVDLGGRRIIKKKKKYKLKHHPTQ